MLNLTNCLCDGVTDFFVISFIVILFIKMLCGSKNYKLNNNLNEFFKYLKLKKQYIKECQGVLLNLNNIKEKNYRYLNSTFFNTNKLLKYGNDNLVFYIIDISFSKTNTLLHVTDFSGNLKFFCSAGLFKYTGKRKKARFQVFKNFYNILLSKLTFLKRKPTALHLKNVGNAKFWIIKKLKKKIYIKVIRNFNLYPHNGCRKKKVRRKKFKKRRNG